jgi:transposase-like protein
LVSVVLLSILRDKYGRFKAYKRNLIDCACGCKTKIYDRDSKGRIRKFIRGHWNWKGWRFQCEGYWLVLKPEHHEADKKGYVREHRLVYEEYYKCCLLPWARIHHDDNNGLNNKIDNLILTSKWEHHNKFHREDYRQICERCGSTNVHRNGFNKMGKQVFECRDCMLGWAVNKTVALDYSQTCLYCNSKCVIKRGIEYGRQRFKCKGCKKSWSIPIANLMIKRRGNDLRYEEKKKQKLVMVTKRIGRRA